MSILSERDNANAAKRANVTTPAIMHSVAGAMWQESAIARITAKGTPAHLAIGRLVTAINNSQITVERAEREFVSLLRGD